MSNPIEYKIAELLQMVKLQDLKNHKTECLLATFVTNMEWHKNHSGEENQLRDNLLEYYWNERNNH